MSVLFSKLPSIVGCFYRCMLLVYPTPYRQKYGRLMTQLVNDLCLDVCRRKSIAGFFWLCGHVWIDTISSAVTEYLDILKEAYMMSWRQHLSVLIFAGLPLEVGVALFLINPAFMSRLITPNAAQPIGWLVVSGILALVSAAYVVQRKSLMTDATQRSAVLIRSTLLFVLPAIVLVLLGPAFVTLLQRGIIP